jgi:hypothetical protein
MEILSQKQNKKKRAGGVAPVAEPLLSKWKVLGSIPMEKKKR